MQSTLLIVACPLATQKQPEAPIQVVAILATKFPVPDHAHNQRKKQRATSIRLLNTECRIRAFLTASLYFFRVNVVQLQHAFLLTKD